MHRAIDAIYEHGSFRPINRELLSIPEGQRVRITVEDGNATVEDGDLTVEVGDPESLRTALSVYDGLSDDDIDEIEKIALDRSKFFGSGKGN